MDTSVEGSDISLSDFTESKKVTRKRKRNIPPLKFQEDPLDTTFYSPDRPLAVPNPIGAPAVDVLGQTNTWISLDEFGQMTATRRLPRRRPTRGGNNDVITCSRADCAHPLHVHNRDVGKRRINISDNDSDLLISISDTKSQKEPKSANQKDMNCVIASSNEEKENILSDSNSSYIDSGIGKTQKEPSSPSKNESNSNELHSDSHVKVETTVDISITSCSNETNVTPNIRSHVSKTPTLHSPSFHRVGFSQCKPGKTVKRTRQIPDTESYPDPVYVEKDDLRRRVVFESPRTPMKVGLRNSEKVLETPESSRSEVLVEDTPEHLVGMRMVTRRLRRVLKQTIPDSLNF